MTTVKESMGAGNNVYLRGFGSFVVKTRKEKTARNISKNTAIKIPEHKVPTSGGEPLIGQVRRDTDSDGILKILVILKPNNDAKRKKEKRP